MRFMCQKMIASFAANIGKGESKLVRTPHSKEKLERVKSRYYLPGKLFLCSLNEVRESSLAV